MSEVRPRGLKRIGERENSLIDLATLRKQCEIVATDIDSDGVESHPDDALLSIYLESAIDMAEEFTGLAVGLQTFEMGYDEFPDGEIELPAAPFVDLVNFSVGDESDGIVDDTTYQIDTYSQLARLVPVTVWPTVVASMNTIKIRWRAGYSATDEDAPPLPESIKLALLLIVGHFYAHREDTNDKVLSTIPNGFEALLRPKRVRYGMA